MISDLLSSFPYRIAEQVLKYWRFSKKVTYKGFKYVKNTLTEMLTKINLEMPMPTIVKSIGFNGSFVR